MKIFVNKEKLTTIKLNNKNIKYKTKKNVKRNIKLRIKNV